MRSIRAVPASSIVLNPIADNRISGEDRTTMENNGLVGLDCSWNRSEEIFPQRIPGMPRRLPALLAGNPTNYAVLGKLSTAEALAAALFITGFTTQADKILSLFRWGATFLALNKDPLEAYAKASLSDLPSLEAEFFNLN